MQRCGCLHCLDCWAVPQGTVHLAQMPNKSLPCATVGQDSKVWSEPFCTCLPSLILRYKQVTTTYRFFSLQLSQTRTSLHSPVTAEVLVTRLQLNHHKSPNQLPQLQDGPYKNGYCPQTPIYIFFLLKNNGQKTPLPKD